MDSEPSPKNTTKRKLITSASTAAATFVATQTKPTFAATPQIETKAPSSQTKTFDKEKFAQEFPEEKITEVLTYGQDKAYSEEKMKALFKNLNELPVEMKEDTYYGTFFISESVYREFNQYLGKDFQTFLSQHAQELDRLLREANPPTEGGFKLRRLIVLKDGVVPPASHHLGWEQAGIKDSDGQWFFNHFYRPDKTAFYNYQKKIDYGLIHEWGHAILHLADQYALDYHGQDDQIINSIAPEGWRTYMASHRPEYNGEIMAAPNGSNPRFREYSAWQLKRRQSYKHTHFSEHNLRLDLKSYPAEFPKQMDWEFQDIRGANIPIKEVAVFRTHPTHKGGYSKAIKWEPVKVLQDPKFDPLSLFESKDGMVTLEASTLLLYITDTNNQTHFRWLDIRDFNIPFWRGMKEQAKLVLKVLPAKGGAIPSPASFDWTVQYKPYEQF